MEAARWFQLVVTKRHVAFDGRARPAEFWCYMLVLVVLAAIQTPMHTKVLTSLAGLLLFAPTLGVEIRRMHDIGKSGWWLLIACVPVIGAFVLLYWFMQPGTAGPNAFGPDPKSG